jgi:AAA+ superfamily predicted ATPase
VQLGKTLSAEIYSEAIKKPLYRVHSGQLGIDAVSVETNLETILNRAQRWDAVLLIDEADVFVRQRGNDIQHNAVVASFLRTLEYFSGLLFLTTNRAGDIDDAILSRCIAVIHYEYPSKEDARKIWNVLAKQFELTIEPEVIEELLEMFKKVSGRDVKELLKLTSKFARHKNVKLTSDVFRQCAMFRGL